MPIIETDFARALREADERQVAKLAQTTDQDQASKRHSNGRPKIPVTKPVVSYRRSVLRSVLDEQVSTFEEDVPIVRKRTVHVVPVAVQAAEQDQRAVERKLRYQAGKIGSAWSKWINEARPGGWNHVEPKLTSDWASFMENLAGFDTDKRAAILAAAGSGMNLEREFITSGTLTNDNKLSYMTNAASARRHLLIGVERVPIGRGRVSSGAFFVVSVGHLSALEPSSDPLQALRDSLVEQCTISGELGIRDVYTAVGDWAGKPQAREHFAQRVQTLT